MSNLSTFPPPQRDAKGRLLEAPVWLKPGWQHVNAAGLGTGGALRKFCARKHCRQLALKSSLYCRNHDFHGRRRRMAEVRAGTGRPPTPTELARLHRANAKNLWQRAPWYPTLTIWLAPKFEATFAEHCRRGGLPPSQTAPVILDTLRWAWRRSVLNYPDDPGWHRALAAARKRQATIGPPPVDYDYVPVDLQPTDPRIRVVVRRDAKARPPVDRTTKHKTRKARSYWLRVSTRFGWREFLAEHWRATFGPLFAAHHLDPIEADGELGRQLAVTWHKVLAEQARLGEGACGAAYGRWMTLLRQIKQDQEQGSGHYLRRP